MTNDSKIKDIIYKRKNGEDIVNDPEAIKSCKNEQSRDIIDNARLGGYDKFGNYIIIPEIKHELINMPKLIYNTKIDRDSATYELKGTIPVFGDVFFKLTFTKSEAILYLTENVKREANGYLEIYDEPIDSCGSGDGGLPKDMIFKNYHIKETLDDFGKNNNLYDFNNILTRKVYLSLLSKELRAISKVDEKTAFDKMVKTLKAGGEYGKKVLTEFVSRLKERPGIFEIEKSDKYNKAVNEVLLSSLEVSTTEEDKEDYDKRQTYLAVLNARNENIDSYLAEANKRVDEKRVEKIVNEATANFNQGKEQGEEENEFIESLKDGKQTSKKHTIDKAILKQGKEPEEQKENEKEKTSENKKEDEIKKIIDKKDEKQKKTPKNKKLKPAKKAKKTKLKPKKKSAKKSAKKVKKKKLAKGKLKKKKKKLAKAKAPQKAKAKVGGKLKPPASKAKAKKKDNSLIARLMVNKFFDKPEVQEEQPLVYRKFEEQKPVEKKEEIKKDDTDKKPFYTILKEDKIIEGNKVNNKARSPRTDSLKSSITRLGENGTAEINQVSLDELNDNPFNEIIQNSPKIQPTSSHILEPIVKQSIEPNALENNDAVQSGSPLPNATPQNPTPGNDQTIVLQPQNIDLEE